MATPESNELTTNNMPSPRSASTSPNNSLLSLPSPIITRRTRTHSTCERAMQNPIQRGNIKDFCRQKGHGFISPCDGGGPIFVHISDIEGEYVPLPGDEVAYRLCPVPPKFEKTQAIHVQITHFCPEKHQRWDEGHHI